MTPEGKIKQSVKNLLKQYPTWHFMPVSNGLGKHGVPDFCCVLNARGKGLAFFVETKAPGKKPTALQLLCKREIEAACGKWFLVYGEESLKVLQIWIEGEL